MLRQFVLRAPPNLVEGFGSARSAKPSPRGYRRHPAQAFTGAAGAICSIPSRARPARCGRAFRERLVKRCFGFVRLRRHLRQPLRGGLALVILHHAFGEVNGKKGVGPRDRRHGAITLAMARAARGHGRRDRTEAGVREVIVEGGRAAGVPSTMARPSARNTSSPASIRNSDRGSCLRRTGAEFRERIARWRKAPAPSG